MSKVLCVGEILIDFVCTDTDKSIIEGVNFIKKAGGAPANAAVAIQKMGVDAYMLGCVGDDQFGEFLINTIKKYNVNTDMLFQLKNHCTTLAFVSLKADGERDFMFNRDADSMLSFDMIDKSILEETKVFHFGSATAFLPGSLQKTYYDLLEYAKIKGKIISFDPNYRSDLFGNNKDEFIKHCKYFTQFADIIKVSDEEAEILTGYEDVEQSAKMLVSMGAKYVLITLGSKGTLICSNGKLVYVPVKPVKMVDATGAGDAFIGSVIASIAKGSELSINIMEEYVAFANKVGAITVTKYGAIASIPYYEDV